MALVYTHLNLNKIQTSLYMPYDRIQKFSKIPKGDTDSVMSLADDLRTRSDHQNLYIKTIIQHIVS